MFALPQRHQDFAIGGSQRHAVGECEVEAIVGEPDIVENVGEIFARDHAANRFFHLRELLLGFLDTRTAGAAHVKTDLAGINLRKKVRPDEGVQRDAGDRHEDEACDH